jgi:DNA repair photolyase
MSVIYEPRGRAREYGELACNLYTGCDHGCKYCYAPSCLQRTRVEFHQNVQPRKNILDEMRKDLRKISPGKRIFLCFTCDPYCNRTTDITAEAIKLIHLAKCHIDVLTKGAKRAIKDMHLYQENDKFGSTLTFDNDVQSFDWEPGAARPIERIETLRAFHEAGVKTWVSFEPVIEPEQVYNLLDQTHEFIDLYKVGTLNHHERSKEIDWCLFGNKIKSLLERYGKEYYIKEDLRRKM